jgi:hypothetical protein
MVVARDRARDAPRSIVPLPPPLAPILMMSFWMLLGGAAGIRLSQSVWQLLDWGAGDVSVAVPVGGVVGALVGALLGLISNPRFLVLLMAVFAGSAAGAVAGKVPWGDIGEVGGQIGGGLVGGIAWAVWLFFEARKEPDFCIPAPAAARSWSRGAAPPGDSEDRPVSNGTDDRAPLTRDRARHRSLPGL